MECVPFKRHIEGKYDKLTNNLIQKIYFYLFSFIDKHETYKRMANEAEFEKLMLRVTNNNTESLPLL